MFGLLTSSQLAATRGRNSRRQVFYQYPNGKFPLMGLLSLMDEGEQLSDQTFGWWEKRFRYPSSQTTSADGTNGPFTDTSGAAGAVGANKTTAGFSQSAGDTVRVKVVDTSVFRVRDCVLIHQAPGAASTYVEFQGIVDAVWPTASTIDVRLVSGITNMLNTSAANSQYVYFISSAAVEGGFSKLGGYTFPVKPYNYTQIIRTPVGPWSRNALQMGQEFDKTGVYKDDCRESHIRHMIACEMPCYFGKLGLDQVVDTDDGVSKPEYKTAGLIDVLTQWEYGNVGNGGRVDYRPGGSDIRSSDWKTEDLKRVINLYNGTVTKRQFYRLIEMAFRYTGDNSFEKLVCCGSGFLGVFNAFAEANSLKVVDLSSKEDTYGMTVTKWTTHWGDLFFKVHPLFTENPMTRYSAAILDVGSIKYHSFAGADGQLLKNRQANDYDGRKDEFLTEFGLEWKMPERHMWIDQLGGITV